MDRSAYTAHDILLTLQRELQVDPEWVIPIENGFQWWPGHLAQPIWIEDGEPKRLHIETDCLRQVAIDERTLGLVAYANRFATFNALILQPEDESLRLHASIFLSERKGVETNRLAFLTAAVQAADAHAKFLGMAEFFRADPDFTSHPKSGHRDAGHNILHVLEGIRAKSEVAGSLAQLDFKPLQEWKPRPWVMAFGGKGGLTAEFSFVGNEPSTLLAATGDTDGPRTALFRLTTDFEHPQMKHGLLARLTLPVNGNFEVANALNRAEAFGPSVAGASQLGAWCIGDTELVFATFVPTILFNQNLLEDLIYGTAYRALWARELLFGRAA